MEQQILQHHVDRALPRLTHIYPTNTSPYVPIYQADRLLRLGYAEQAANLVNAYGKQLASDEAAILRLRAYRIKGWTSLAGPEFENLMQLPLTSRTATLSCAYLLEWPDRASAVRLLQEFVASGPALANETLPLYQALFLLATTSEQTEQASQIIGRLNAFTKSDGKALHGLGELLRTNPVSTQLGQLLPSVALPIEVIYALQSRAPAPPSSPGKL
jgi:hypothetical protein